MIKLTKKFRFEAAHAILNYEGPCKNIHGHSYVLEVTVSGHKDPETGMVVDFKILKKTVEECLLNHLDHALLYRKDHPGAAFLLDYAGKLFPMDQEPTAENLLELAVFRIEPGLPTGIKLESLKLFETESSFAEWVPEK